MVTTYTWDIFCTLDGFGSYGPGGDWGGYWGKQGPEFLAHRLEQFQADMRMAFGATTFREFVQMVAEGNDPDVFDDWVTRMRNFPATVISSTLEEPLDWHDATLVRGDAVEIVAALKEKPDVPLRSHSSLSLNHTLLKAGLVDHLQVTIFPVLSGRVGTKPVFAGADDFDLDLLESRTFDGRIQELVYRPTLHR